MGRTRVGVFGERILRSFRRYGIRELPLRGLKWLTDRMFPGYCGVYKHSNDIRILDGIVTLCDVSTVNRSTVRYIEQLELAEGVAHAQEILMGQEEGVNVYLIINKETVVGFCKTKRAQFMTRWYKRLERDDIVIFGVTVFPEHRGRGFAPAAYEELCRLNCDVENIYLDARQENRAAVRAIEKAGFVLEGRYRVGDMTDFHSVEMD